MKVLLEIVRSSNPHRRHISLTVMLAFEHKLVMSGLQQKGGWNKNVLRRSREVCPYETFSVWLRKKREREHSSTEERVCEASCVCVCASDFGLVTAGLCRRCEQNVAAALACVRLLPSWSITMMVWFQLGQRKDREELPFTWWLVSCLWRKLQISAHWSDADITLHRLFLGMFFTGSSAR